MIYYLVDLFYYFFGKEKTAVHSNISQKDFRTFKKNSARAAKKARNIFPYKWRI